MSTYSGKYKPKNPEKYKGDWRKMTYRSSWELFVMQWADSNPRIVKWGSETVVIPYFSSLDQKQRRYYMDFYVMFDTGQEYLFEVKPFKETIPPVKPKRMTPKSKQRYENEVYTYGVNMDKWKAAKIAAEKNNMEFRLLTEKSLKKLGMRR